MKKTLWFSIRVVANYDADPDGVQQLIQSLIDGARQGVTDDVFEIELERSAPEGTDDE